MILFGGLILCTGIVWFILRSSSIQTYDAGLTVNLFLRNLLAIPAALSMFVVPYDFSTAPGFTLTKIVFGLALLLILIVMTIVKSSHSRRKKIFYLLWFILLLFPTFFARTKEWDYLDHRFLLPLIGVLMFLLSFIQNIGKIKIAVLSSVLIIVFSTVSIFKSRAFSNPHAFCEALKHNKNNPEAYHFLKGNLEQISEKYEKALKEYDIAIAYNPNHIRSFNNRAIVKQQLGDLKGALADYNRAIDLGVKNYHIFKNRGDVRLQLEDFAGAIDDYSAALQYEQNAPAHFNRAVAKFVSLDYAGALEDCDMLLAIDPQYPNAQALKTEIQKQHTTH
jgi:hypothetical protein